MVFGIIVVGGITRLTESGLSMVDWNFQGDLPPRTDEEWAAEFEKYKQYPEFKRLNPNMTVEEFKSIFFWEYLHRMWGRAIGLAFGLPFAYFALRRKLSPDMTRRSAVLLAGVGVQGLLGWWMVKSGLEEPEVDNMQPRVSQYRLATHLSAALLLYVGMLKTTFSLCRGTHHPLPESGRFPPVNRVLTAGRGVASLAFLTAITGAFVAGLDAGLIYNEFPLMGEQIVPVSSWEIGDDFTGTLRNKQWWVDNLFENSSSVQFNHRVMGITTASVISFLYFKTGKLVKSLPRSVQISRHLMFGAAMIQVTLGISTLLMFVPVHLAATHQAGSVALLSSVLWFVHELRRVPK